MLSYTFWHWKQPDVAADAYEARQRAFHAALAATPPSGYARSYSAAIAGAPWANQGGDAYEDWYLVGGFADLGALEEAAVTASRQAPHDAAAALAAGGTAGLYRARLGEVASAAAAAAAPRSAQWFDKPDGVRYPELFAAMAPVVARARGTLWIRQMALGPAAEFCLQAEAPAELPLGIAARPLALRPVWRGGA
ncbi:MAG TPA: hypothetical protein VKA84_17400 [Gemmatimonadaceae bacterium]|nr:hypothetical protein [Gemmatimonadaceae bacterium]